MASFEGETSSIISKITERYGLKDVDENTLEKIEKGEPFIATGAVIIDLATEIVLGKILIRDVPFLLEGYLNISKETALLLTKDIETELLSIAKKKTITETEKLKKQTDIPIEINDNAAMSSELIEEKDKIINPINLNKNENQKETNTKNKQDAYREPIE